MIEANWQTEQGRQYYAQTVRSFMLNVLKNVLPSSGYIDQVSTPKQEVLYVDQATKNVYCMVTFTAILCFPKTLHKMPEDLEDAIREASNEAASIDIQADFLED